MGECAIMGFHFLTWQSLCRFGFTTITSHFLILFWWIFRCIMLHCIINIVVPMLMLKNAETSLSNGEKLKLEFACCQKSTAVGGGTALRKILIWLGKWNIDASSHCWKLICLKLYHSLMLCRFLNTRNDETIHRVSRIFFLWSKYTYVYVSGYSKHYYCHLGCFWIIRKYRPIFSIFFIIDSKIFQMVQIYLYELEDFGYVF